jgi:hypothetical protein
LLLLSAQVHVLHRGIRRSRLSLTNTSDVNLLLPNCRQVKPKTKSIETLPAKVTALPDLVAVSESADVPSLGFAYLKQQVIGEGHS